MSQELLELIERARLVRMTPEDRASQRISFAYGNAKLDNEGMTRGLIERASKDLKVRTGEDREGRRDGEIGEPRP